MQLAPLRFALLALATSVLSGFVHAQSASPRISYDRDVRPILSDRCFACHGMDAAKRAADLRLDSGEEAHKDRGGLRAIAPGSLKDSEVWARITSTDPDDHMPPAESNKRSLDEREREIIRQWIEQGAEYEPHWSFTAPKRPSLPANAKSQHPVDALLALSPAAQKLASAPRADETRLVRRLYLDLTGLPPTPEEVARYMAAPHADRWQRLAQELMNEEPYRTRYAERMALPWLDAARYADTNGIHMDAGRTLWPWRDWVLQAYEHNMPFDQFVVAQVAGDLLPEATQEHKVASGFHRNHVITDEGGAIDEEYLVEYAADRAGTTASVFLGLTMNCARCHDHKFDPISQDEYYSFYAYFNSNEEPGLYSQLPDPKRAFEPFMEVLGPEQAAQRTQLKARIAEASALLAQDDPTEAEQRNAWLQQVLGSSRWVDVATLSATGTNGVELAVQVDGSVLAQGANPARADYLIEMRTEATNLRMVAMEVLADPAHGNRPGRASNGNAVLTSFAMEAVSVADPARSETVEFAWAWADHEQGNGDYRVINVLADSPGEGWALQGHERTGSRMLVLVAKQPFGFEGGTLLRTRLEQQSIYDQHTLRQVRLRAAVVDDAVIARLPLAQSGWYICGPFDGNRETMYATRYGPEDAARIDTRARFDGKGWVYRPEFADGQVNATSDGANVVYAAREIFVTSERVLDVALGSDDGVQLYLDGKLVHENRIDRGAQPNQDAAKLTLTPGRHVLAFKIINTGGQGGFYWRWSPRNDELSGTLVAALLPADARWATLDKEIADEWRGAFSPVWRARKATIAGLEAEQAALEASVPKTMVMRERAMPRDTYTLTRGRYDMPDKSRKRERGIPAALGSLPANAPANRLGLAQWLVSDSNPLVARVAMNRLWEQLFVVGLVRTTEDFGLQGEYPHHPELLDWLAVEFRESGWNVQHMVRLIVSSQAYQRSSNASAAQLQHDPENLNLTWFPRKRLPAEAIRDQALYVAGLLVEQQGGPSVKPYQPEGLWQEVAMPPSNTRVYERGMGADLWRRSLYTYWKRAAPPPSMLTFDAPTREFCNIRRTNTNTPLQALVLWNDEQFVEAARVLATRTLDEVGDDRQRLERMFQRCAVRTPQAAEVARLLAALEHFRARYRAAPEDAAALIQIGEAPTSATHAAEELAAWTMIANSLLNLDATIVRS